MTVNQKFGHAALFDCGDYDPTIDPKPDAEEMAYEYTKLGALDLPDNRLEDLYLEIAIELNRRGNVTFRQDEAE